MIPDEPDDGESAVYDGLLKQALLEIRSPSVTSSVVAMAISGQATDAMRVRYSTAATPEVAKAIGKVVSIATAKPRAGRVKRKAG